MSTLVESLLRTPAPIGDWGETFSLRLARVRPAVRLVREHLGRWLERGGIDADEAFDVTLACSEACANAVEHPVRPRRPAFEIEATRSADVVELVVRDFGTWDESPSSRSRGRGLRMIGALMDSSQVAHDARGARVVMRRACKSGRRSVARG